MIGDGVADKEVVLNNVTVTGKTIVRGGGEKFHYYYRDFGYFGYGDPSSEQQGQHQG